MMEAAPVPKTPREIERELEAELSYTRREFERTARVLSQQALAIGEIPSQDGMVVLENSRRQRDLAYTAYREALRKFTELAAHGVNLAGPSEAPGRDQSDSAKA